MKQTAPAHVEPRVLPMRERAGETAAPEDLQAASARSG